MYGGGICVLVMVQKHKTYAQCPYAPDRSCKWGGVKKRLFKNNIQE